MLTDKKFSFKNCVFYKKCVAILIPEADITSNTRNILSASKVQIVEALQYLIMKNHEPEDLTLPKVLMIITDVIGREADQKGLHKNLLMSGKGLDWPDIYTTLFDNSNESSSPDES